jgi:hypothetical protein
MLSCKEVTELLSKARVTKLSLMESLSLKMHLFMCAACKKFSKQMEFLRSAFNQLQNKVSFDQKLSLESKDKMKRTLLEQK